jgi:hypothetical protein
LVSAVINAEMHSDENKWGEKNIFQKPDHSENPPGTRVLFPINSDYEEKWNSAISARFETEHGRDGALSEAIAYELEGIAAPGSKRVAAVPVVIASGLLQSVSGVVGSVHPEDYAGILHQIFQAGRGNLDGQTCGSHLVNAMQQRIKTDPFLSAVESSVRDGILRPQIDSSTPLEPGAPVGVRKVQQDWNYPSWLQGQTPFSWFSDAWIKLTNQDWVDVLPPRRWVDWLATSARLSLGMSVLWQARYWDEIGELIQNDSADISIASLVERVSLDPLIQWEESTSGLRQRNVQPDYRSLIARGGYVENFLQSRIRAKDISKKDSFEEAIVKLRTKEFRQMLRSDLNRGQNGPKFKRRRDAVESCLTARSVTGRYADHYGFLVRHGRGTAMFRVVDPSSEVLALVASLSCGTPNGECSVGDVRRSLRQLGLRPSIPELVRRLESAGLCRDSADASDSIRVKSAFVRFQ